MENIRLKGGQKLITDDPRKAWQVLEGHVLVYVLPLEEGRPGRRFLIGEMTEGEWIPSLCWENDKLGSWRFALIALEQAVLREIRPKEPEQVKMDFAAVLGIRLFDVEEFEEQMVEQYNINIIKEEGGIYATSLEQEQTYERGLYLIYNMFRKKNRKTKTPVSGNKIYDAAAQICDFMDIHIAPFSVVKESCRRKFDIRDIGRLSHFTSREIVLEEKWYKKDSGPILAYKEKGRTPVVCLPKGPQKYVAYESPESAGVVIDAGYAAALSIKADMVYRPFPPKEMKWKDLLVFGFKCVYIRDIVKIALLAFLGTLVGLLLPVINQQVYDKFIPMADQNGLVQICLLVLACSLGNLSFTIVKNLATFRSMNTMEYAVQSAAYDRLFNLPESFFREYDSADLAQRVMGITSIYQVFADVIVKTIITAVLSLLYLWQMFRYAKPLAKPSILMVLAAMAVIGFIGWRQLKYESRKMELDGKLSSLMFQFLAGISKIRIAGVENRAQYEYLKVYSDIRNINMRKEKMSVGVDVLVGALNVVFSMVLYFWMIRKNVSLSVGAFSAFMSAFGSFSGAMLETVSSFLDVNSAIPAYQRCKPILSALPEMEEETIVPGALTGDIEVSNVTFAYNAESGNVLNDLSFHIRPGEYIGVVGASGGGKSTLMKMLLGFERPQKGKVFYDGKDIDSMDKRELRKKFGVVLQDGDLIAGSIFENITITAPGTTMKRVEKVIEEVGLKDDIDQMPMGLHTVLSENSGTISGGQQQRILIARAIVSNPKILFFDEATSALDNVTQNMVCESLVKLRATRIVIAHRLSTVMDCDRIFVMDQGRIVEEGNYAELMEQGGLFYELASRQLA